MTHNAQELAAHLDDSIAGAIAGRSKLTSEILALPGYSSPRVRHLLNNLCARDCVRYLEIGTWKGSTLLSAAFRNSGRFLGVDDFSQFRFRQWRSPRKLLAAARRRFATECLTELIEADCFSLDLGSLPRDIDVYFYDGDHSAQSQRLAFMHFDPVLADRFIALVDDWNWPQVRDATRSAFAELGYTVIAGHELFSPRNASRDGWWNGLYVAVVGKRAGPARSSCGRR